MSAHHAERKPYVYRIWNDEGVLLYVGSTIYLGLRMKSHRAHARWWHKAKHFAFEAFDTELAARAAEVEAIRSEFPRWNVRDRSPFHPDGRAVNYADILAIYPDDCRFGIGHSPYIAWYRENRVRRAEVGAA